MLFVFIKGYVEVPCSLSHVTMVLNTCNNKINTKKSKFQRLCHF